MAGNTDDTPSEALYDEVADLYAETFPKAYYSALERRAIDAFADIVLAEGLSGPTVDVGCGPGHVTAELAERGLTVVGVDPSVRMVTIAREKHPHLRFQIDDATLSAVHHQQPAALLARFSLIHLEPDQVGSVFAAWAEMLAPGAPVLVATQSTDTDGDPEPFDHKVAAAWRWHPDRLSKQLSDNGFDEVWRTVSRPDADHRFPEIHMLARRRS